MNNQTNEQALEAAIQKCLTGVSLETLLKEGTSVAEANAVYRTKNGYYNGDRSHFDAKYALDTERFWDFLESTQEEELNKLKRSNDWKLKILQRLDRIVKKQGVLHVLKKGLGVDDAHFTLLFPLPLGSSSARVAKDFESNQFSVTRQVPYSESNPREEIDMVIFVNGLPLITLELKNQWTGQNARLHGQNQYRKQRDPKETLLNFGRCLVHMTSDTDEVFMTTKLNGTDTFFLPFNQGYKMVKAIRPIHLVIKQPICGKRYLSQKA